MWFTKDCSGLFYTFDMLFSPRKKEKLLPILIVLFFQPRDKENLLLLLSALNIQNPQHYHIHKTLFYFFFLPQPSASLCEH
jgi:hypothetical protein